MMFTSAARSVTAEASSDALSEGGSEVGAETGVAFGGVADATGADSGFGLGTGGGALFFVVGAVCICAEVVATVSTTASVDEAFGVATMGVCGTVATSDRATTKIPMRKIVAMLM